MTFITFQINIGSLVILSRISRSRGPDKAEAISARIAARP